MSVFILSAILVTGGIASTTATESGVDEGDVEVTVGAWKPGTEKRVTGYVITQSPAYIIKFINRVEGAKGWMLAELFMNRVEAVDEVLAGITFSDDDLISATKHRSDLAGTPTTFFNLLDRMTTVENQERAVGEGVCNLMKDSLSHCVPLLIVRLGERAFRSKRLKTIAIRMAFVRAATKRIPELVEGYYEDPAITPTVYASGLVQSWNGGALNGVLSFLLE